MSKADRVAGRIIALTFAGFLTLLWVTGLQESGFDWHTLVIAILILATVALILYVVGEWD